MPISGTAAEFREMTEAPHDRGIRIILDVVMNHTGYNTVADMAEFGFGKLSGIDGSWRPKPMNGMMLTTR